MNEWHEDPAEDAAHTARFTPDTWRASWDYLQILPVPSPATKRAAEKLVRAEQVQQGLGWLLLAQLAVTLGFLRVMPRSIGWLTWAIFMLEAGVKLTRFWGLACCFRNVPCAYVPFHEGAAKQFIKFFGRGLIGIIIMEVGLSVGYLYAIAYEWTQWADKDGKTPYDDQSAPLSAKTMLELITGAGFLLVVQVGTNLLVLQLYKRAMRLGKSSRALKQVPAFQRHTELDRSLCLTWWVHIARHRHLTAADAKSQPGECGLPGQWYETVPQLKNILEQGAVVGAASHLNLVWLSQEMAMRALLSVAIQGQADQCQLILQDNGFRLLLLVLSEGKPENSRGLAAAAISELADQDCIEKEHVKLSAAVLPLKRLSRSHVVELKEMALGALLNLALNNEQQNHVVTEILSSRDDDYLSDSLGLAMNLGSPDFESQSTFVEFLLYTIRRGPTTQCQVLAAGLLSRLVGNQRVRDIIFLRSSSDGARSGSHVELFVKMLTVGLTDEVQAGIAGLIWELAFWDARALWDDPHGYECVESLVTALWGEPLVAAAAAGALASLAFNSGPEKKLSIVELEGSLEGLVRLLKDESNLRARHTDGHSLHMIKVLEQGQAQAARALRILAIGNEENQNLIVHTGAIADIVKLLQKNNSYIHMQAAATLDVLANRNRRVQDFIGSHYPEIFTRLAQLLDPGRYDVLDALAGKSDHNHILEMVLEKAALAVRSIADGHRGNRERFLEAGAKERLQSILIRDRGRENRGKSLHGVVEKALCTLQ